MPVSLCTGKSPALMLVSAPVKIVTVTGPAAGAGHGPVPGAGAHPAMQATALVAAATAAATMARGRHEVIRRMAITRPPAG
jgi:hypothetical protein